MKAARDLGGVALVVEAEEALEDFLASALAEGEPDALRIEDRVSYARPGAQYAKSGSR